MSEQPSATVQRALYRPVRRTNALEDTVSRIVQAIRVGVVAPGEALPPERGLAEMYGVSRDTVREAIRELTVAGFVVPRRGRYGGTFVADPLPRAEKPVGVTAVELEDTLGMRRVLEGGAARAAARRTMTATERDALWQSQVLTSAAHLDDYRRLDSLLHLAIAEASGIPSLVPLVAENRARINSWLDTFALMPRTIEHSEVQHESIVSAILAGREEAAEAAMLAHVAASEALLRGFLS